MAIDLFTIGKITVHGYGLMIGLGFLAAVLLGTYRAKIRGLSPDHFINMAIFVLLFGFLGGKILFIIVYFKDFLSDPLGTLGTEGFVVYGGVVTGILSIVLYCKIKKISAASYLDLFAPSVAINQGIGRIGCFMAGCCYGRETDGPLGVIFPEGCLAPAGVKLLPTQLFSAAGMFVIALGLILYARRAKYRLCVTGWYLLAYSIGRFVIEIFRNDPRGNVGSLSTSQFISILLFVISIGLLIFAYKKKIPVEFPVPFTSANYVKTASKERPADEPAEERQQDHTDVS